MRYAIPESEPTLDNPRMIVDELTNTRLIQKIKAAEKPQASKSLVNVSLAINESLRIENGTQYTNYQMISSIKNQI